MNLGAGRKRIEIHTAKLRQKVATARKEIRRLVEGKQMELARVKAANAIRDELLCETFALLDVHLAEIKASLSLIDTSSEASAPPPALNEAICSLIFASTRVEIDEIKELTSQFMLKYGEEWGKVAHRDERREADPSVVRKLTIFPNDGLIDEYLLDVCPDWDFEKGAMETSEAGNSEKEEEALPPQTAQDVERELEAMKKGVEPAWRKEKDDEEDEIEAEDAAQDSSGFPLPPPDFGSMNPEEGEEEEENDDEIPEIPDSLLGAPTVYPHSSQASLSSQQPQPLQPQPQQQPLPSLFSSPSVPLSPPPFDPTTASSGATSMSISKSVLQDDEVPSLASKALPSLDAILPDASQGVHSEANEEDDFDDADDLMARFAALSAKTPASSSSSANKEKSEVDEEPQRPPSLSASTADASNLELLNLFPTIAKNSSERSDVVAVDAGDEQLLFPTLPTKGEEGEEKNQEKNDDKENEDEDDDFAALTRRFNSLKN